MISSTETDTYNAANDTFVIDGFTLPGDMLVVNCCECNVLLAANEKQSELYRPSATEDKFPEAVHMRIFNRPYCYQCITHKPRWQSQQEKEIDDADEVSASDSME